MGKLVLALSRAQHVGLSKMAYNRLECKELSTTMAKLLLAHWQYFLFLPHPVSCLLDTSIYGSSYAAMHGIDVNKLRMSCPASVYLTSPSLNVPWYYQEASRSPSSRTSIVSRIY